MNTSHVKYVLVGGGGAGSAAAEAIRKYDRQGSILLVSQEHSRPYVRPTLSKEFLRRQKSRAEISDDRGPDIQRTTKPPPPATAIEPMAAYRRDADTLCSYEHGTPRAQPPSVSN